MGLKTVPLEPEVESIIRAALNRHRIGAEKYGVLDPATDTRNLFHEIEEELLDTINYACYQVLQIRALRERLNEGS